MYLIKDIDKDCSFWEEFRAVAVCGIKGECEWRENNICRMPKAAFCPIEREAMKRRTKKNNILSGADMIIIRDKENREVAEITEDRIMEMNGGKVFWHGKKG